MAEKKATGVKGQSGFTIISKEAIAYIAKGDKDKIEFLSKYAQGEITEENVKETVEFLNGMSKELEVLGKNKEESKEVSEKKSEQNNAETSTAGGEKLTKAEIRAKQKEDDRFERIRAQMILEAFGMTADEYKEYYEKYEQAKADLANKPMSEFDELKEAGNIADGARRVLKGDDKALPSKFIDATLAVNSALSGPIAALGATVAGISATLPIVGAAISVFSLVLLGVRHHKTKKQDASDFEAKNRDYEKKLIAFIEKVQSFETKINGMKDEILNASKKFKSKEEYRAYVTSIAQKVMSEVKAEFGTAISMDDVKSDLNLDGDMQFDEAKKDEQPQENPEENEIQEKKAGSETARVKTEEKTNNQQQLKNNAEEQVQLGD